jgi:glycosyltransferase involved in cell wall biosynthesis
MKVCVLTSTHKWNDNRVFYKETLSLADLGHEVVYIAQEATNAIEIDKRIKCIDLPPKNKLGATSLKGMLNIYKVAKREKCDVYHLQDPDLIYVGLLLKMTTRAKVVYDVHEDYPNDMLTKYYLKPYKRHILKYFMAFSEWLANVFFDAIVTADNFVLKQFSPKKSVVLYNYPDTNLIDEALRGGECDYEKKWDVIFPGTTTEYIINTILGVAKCIQDKEREIKVAIISPFVVSGGIEWVRTRVKELGLDENNVHLQKRVPTYEVPRLIRASKVGIIPWENVLKLHKNIPTKLFEYWYCGIPVVVADLPPSAQFVNKANGAFLIKPDSIEDYAEKIIYLLDNPDAANRMAEIGRELVVKECNWDAEKIKLKELYERLSM